MAGEDQFDVVGTTNVEIVGDEAVKKARARLAQVAKPLDSSVNPTPAWMAWRRDHRYGGPAAPMAKLIPFCANDRHLAEDVVQETLLVAYNHRLSAAVARDAGGCWTCGGPVCRRARL